MLKVKYIFGGKVNCKRIAVSIIIACHLTRAPSEDLLCSQSEGFLEISATDMSHEGLNCSEGKFVTVREQRN